MDEAKKFFEKAGFPSLAKAVTLVNSRAGGKKGDLIRASLRPALREVQALGEKRDRWWEVPGTRSFLEIEDRKVQGILALV